MILFQKKFKFFRVNYISSLKIERGVQKRILNYNIIQLNISFLYINIIHIKTYFNIVLLENIFKDNTKC